MTQSCHDRAKMLFCMQTTHREFTGQLRVASGPWRVVDFSSRGSRLSVIPLKGMLSLNTTLAHLKHTAPRNDAARMNCLHPSEKRSVHRSDKKDHNAADQHSTRDGQTGDVRRCTRLRLKRTNRNLFLLCIIFENTQSVFTSDLQKLISIASSEKISGFADMPSI